MKKSGILMLAGASLLAAVVFLASAQGNQQGFRARLTGFNEVPVVSSAGSGELRLSLNPSDGTMSYQLQYENLEGTSTLFAHVHFGQPSINGGISFFLCGGDAKPACPIRSGTVSGKVVASNVIGPIPQGIATSELTEIVNGLRAGVAYANVHTDKHPGGEIRGQIVATAGEK